MKNILNEVKSLNEKFEKVLEIKINTLQKKYTDFLEIDGINIISLISYVIRVEQPYSDHSKKVSYYVNVELKQFISEKINKEVKYIIDKEFNIYKSKLFNLKKLINFKL